jgi:methionine sulfoxide reductase heme-binding subunit
MGTFYGMLGKTYRTILLLPAIFWIYEIANGQSGADPAKEYLLASGELALYYLLANLFLGTALAFGLRLPAWLRFLVLGRRYLGVVTFVYLAAHVFLYFALEGFEGQAIAQVITKLYLSLAAGAWTILLLMALTSNNFSLQILGFRRWKNLHRLVHLAAALVTGHVLLIEKSDLMKFGVSFALLWLLQLSCFLWRKSHELVQPKGDLGEKK